MIDLHCHLLPGIDDGSPDRDTSLAMARMAVADGITHIACTPHITPGVYDNSAQAISDLTLAMNRVLQQQGIALTLCIGADVHMAPDLAQKLRDKRVPALNDTRYFLLEPPHHVAPPRLDTLVRSLIAADFVPIITHPERLGWIESHYALMGALVAEGALIQLTAGSVTGGFGRRARYWAEKLLDEGLADIVASDAHNLTGRPPVLSRARDVLADRVGEAEAWQMVLHRPAAILDDQPLARRVPAISPQSGTRENRQRSGLGSWIRNLRG